MIAICTFAWFFRSFVWYQRSNTWSRQKNPENHVTNGSNHAKVHIKQNYGRVHKGFGVLQSPNLDTSDYPGKATAAIWISFVWYQRSNTWSRQKNPENHVTNGSNHAKVHIAIIKIRTDCLNSRFYHVAWLLPLVTWFSGFFCLDHVFERWYQTKLRKGAQYTDRSHL
jgi:hypothetical protein